MKPKRDTEKTTIEKIALFRSCFSGLTHVYGTRDTATGRPWQEKKPVTDTTIWDHLQGKQPYGVYLLIGDRTGAIAVDFDSDDLSPPLQCIGTATHYGLPAYLETSKSKGYHVWIFFEEKGVRASKARRVVSHILTEIGYPHTEIFPKQDVLDTRCSFGNFIFTPLFGQLVPEGKTVFIDPVTLVPYPNQWAFLESITRVTEEMLDDIIMLNELPEPETPTQEPPNTSFRMMSNRYGLPPCIITILHDGVTRYQRVTCFRLAVHFKRIGLPYDVAVAALKIWALKNRPPNGKRIIPERDIIDQAAYAYDHEYVSYGCKSEAIALFCDPICPVKQ